MSDDWILKIKFQPVIHLAMKMIVTWSQVVMT